MTTTKKEVSPMKQYAMDAYKEAKRLDDHGTFEEVIESIPVMYNGTTGNSYSMRNIFILFQQVAKSGKKMESEFAGFGQWKNAGMKVKKGAKAFYVYSPLIKKEKDSEGTDYTTVKGCFFQAVFAKSDVETI